MGRGTASAEGLSAVPERCKTSWNQISQSGDLVPCTRTKHAAVIHGRDLYLLGGRKGNVALKDFWKFHIDENYWEKPKISGSTPGYLQDHSMVEYQDMLYVFGGEISFCNDQETPLWSFDTKTNNWKKHTTSNGARAPKSMRGHSATVYKDSMFIYGGYQDLKGSSGDMWMFHFPSKSWHLVFQSEPAAGVCFAPKPRHHHTAVLHDSNIWIYGGVNNLQPTSDFAKFDLEWQTWQPLKTKLGPACLQSHSAVKYQNRMLLIGGKKDGHLSENIWMFHFATEVWEKLDAGIEQPQPRHDFIALTFALNINKETTQGEDYEDESDHTKLTSSSIKSDASNEYRENPRELTRQITVGFTKPSAYVPLMNESEETLAKYDEIHGSHGQKSKKASNRTSKLSRLTIRQATSLTGLNKMSAYVPLLNESVESEANFSENENETTSLCSQKRNMDQEPFCIFNCSSDKAELHFPQSSEDSGVERRHSKDRNIRTESDDSGIDSHQNNWDEDEFHKDTHALFAGALKNSFEDKERPGVELRETRHNEEPSSTKSKSYNDISVLIVGGMVEGQVPWLKETLSLWQVQISKDRNIR